MWKTPKYLDWYLTHSSPKVTKPQKLKALIPSSIPWYYVGLHPPERCSQVSPGANSTMEGQLMNRELHWIKFTLHCSTDRPTFEHHSRSERARICPACQGISIVIDLCYRITSGLHIFPASSPYLQLFLITSFTRARKACPFPYGTVSCLASVSHPFLRLLFSLMSHPCTFEVLFSILLRKRGSFPWGSLIRNPFSISKAGGQDMISNSLPRFPLCQDMWHGDKK